MFRRILLAALVGLLSMRCFSQSIDEKIGTAINHSDWFALDSISKDSTPTLPINDGEDDEKIWFEPEEPAYYLNGGHEGLMNDLYSTILKTATPQQEEVAGRAIVRFDISKEGQIVPSSIKVIRNMSVPEDYLDSAIEAIKSLRKFEPGKMNGIPKKVAMTLPIIYPIPLDKIKSCE